MALSFPCGAEKPPPRPSAKGSSLLSTCTASLPASPFSICEIAGRLARAAQQTGSTDSPAARLMQRLLESETQSLVRSEQQGLWSLEASSTAAESRSLQSEEIQTQETSGLSLDLASLRRRSAAADAANAQTRSNSASRVHRGEQAFARPSCSSRGLHSASSATPLKSGAGSTTTHRSSTASSLPRFPRPQTAPLSAESFRQSDRVPPATAPAEAANVSLFRRVLSNGAGGRNDSETSSSGRLACQTARQRGGGADGSARETNISAQQRSESVSTPREAENRLASPPRTHAALYRQTDGRLDSLSELERLRAEIGKNKTRLVAEDPDARSSRLR